MRGRAIGLGLLGLGAFALVAALMVRVFLVPALVKLPLEQEADPVAIGSDVSWFDQGKLEQNHGLDVVVHQHVRGNPAADGAGDDLAVWEFGSSMFTSDGEGIDWSNYRVCLDRHTAQSVDCPSTRVNDDRNATIEGLTLTFPFGMEKKDYDVFNASTGKPFPARFDGVETIKGVEVYRFVQAIPDTVVKTAEVPGALAGAPDEASVEAEAVYTNERTMWVEPTSGVIVTAEEHPSVVLRGPDGTTGVTMLAGDFAADEKTLAAGVKRAEDVRAQITAVKSTLPLALVAVGVLAMLAGALLARRASRVEPEAPLDDAVADTTRVPQVQ